ncbi:hypothetical protein AVEN_161485-1 [Araneus ventricosus]|uniref:Uncharacterized protein n=1 Tax=Araneus ventricosus TaxID=182803 RepID=A0A4Y2LIF2_ARAVE|nr:hypothetical protein AVEN_161485-1 [Araneus ventricosus]
MQRFHFFSRPLHHGIWTAEINCASEEDRITRPDRRQNLPRRRSLVKPFFELWTNLYFTSFVVTGIGSKYFLDSSFVYLEQSRTTNPPKKCSDCPETSNTRKLY